MRVAIIEKNKNIDNSQYDKVISVDPFSEFFIDYNPTEEYFKKIEEIAVFYKKQSGYADIKGYLGKFIINIFLEREEIETETKISLFFENRKEKIIFYNFTKFPLLFLKRKFTVIDSYNTNRKVFFVVKRLLKDIFSFFFDRNILFLKNRYKKDRRYKNIIKVWVDASLKIYKNIIEEEREDTLLFLQPFNINKERQKKNIEAIKRSGVDFYRNIYILSFNNILTLMEQVWKDLMKYSRKPYIVFFRMEVFLRKQMADKEVKRILMFSPENVFTKEEFKAESILVSSELIKRDIFVQNTMHGTGLYNMYQVYSVFAVYGEFYKDFYSRKIKAQYIYYNPFSKYNVEKNIKKEYNKKNIGIIMQYINSKYSISYYKKMVELTEELLKEGYTVYVKEHPNQKNENRIEKKEKLTGVDSAEKLYDNVDIVITGFSTMGYESILKGKICFFVNDRSYNLTPIGFYCPEFIFENERSLILAIKNITHENKDMLLTKEKECLNYIIRQGEEDYVS